MTACMSMCGCTYKVPRSVFVEGHLHLVLSTCLIALVGVAVKSKKDMLNKSSIEHIPRAHDAHATNHSLSFLIMHVAIDIYL